MRRVQLLWLYLAIAWGWRLNRYQDHNNLGITGREVFDNPPHWPAQHLHILQQGNLALRNHLVMLDYLILHPQAAKAYAEFKQ